MQPYLQQQLSQETTTTLVRCRTRTTPIPFTTMRWDKVKKEERICKRCNADIDDEDHFFLHCPYTGDQRVEHRDIMHPLPSLKELFNMEPRKLGQFIGDRFTPFQITCLKPPKPKKLDEKDKPGSKRKRAIDAVARAVRKQRCTARRRTALQSV